MYCVDFLGSYYYNTSMPCYDDSYKSKHGSDFAVSQTELRGSNHPVTHTDLHYHRDIELLFVEEGESLMQVGGETFRCKQGSFILVNPYEVHGGQTDSIDYSHRCICFDLSVLGLPEAAALLSHEAAYPHYIEDAVGLQPYFLACYKAVQERTDGWELRAKGNLLLLFSLLTQQLRTAVPTKEQLFLRNVLDFLDAHFHEDITSAEPAAFFSYDHSYFCRKFRRLFGQSFTEYLHTYRINRAKELLRTHSVTETATLCGFSSVSYFSRVFKRLTGVAPSAFG